MTAPVRPAATVILLRDAVSDPGSDSSGGVEVWLLRRVKAMAFAAGASVFPGGRVDAVDGSGDVAWAGADPARTAERFGCEVSDARASTVAAIRETFEETGVLLTRPPHDVVSDVDAGLLADRRRQVEAHEVAFTALLDELGLAVDADLIRPWAHWITPAAEPRRYDTFFYVAALPSGATAHAETTEAIEAGWITPAEALAEHARGERPMLPPTVVALREMIEFPSVDAVLEGSSGRSLAVVEPEFVTIDGRLQIRLPDGQLFPVP